MARSVEYHSLVGGYSFVSEVDLEVEYHSRYIHFYKDAMYCTEKMGY
jgi:hypothetical protein